MRYKTKVLLAGGVPVAELVSELQKYHPVTADMLPTPMEEGWAWLKPSFKYWVRDCKVWLASELFKGSSSFLLLFDLPDKLYEEALKDIAKQGGGLNMSGTYDILSHGVWRYIESKRFRRKLAAEIAANGFTVVDEDD